jgi:hypothetical protein
MSSFGVSSENFIEHESAAKEASALADFIEQKVVDIRVENGSILVLVFENESILKLFDNSKIYESFVLKQAQVALVIV